MFLQLINKTQSCHTDTACIDPFLHQWHELALTREHKKLNRMSAPILDGFIEEPAYRQQLGPLDQIAPSATKPSLFKVWKGISTTNVKTKVRRIKAMAFYTLSFSCLWQKLGKCILDCYNLQPHFHSERLLVTSNYMNSPNSQEETGTANLKHAHY